MNPIGPKSNLPELRAALSAYGYGKTNPKDAASVIPKRPQPLPEDRPQPDLAGIAIDEIRAAMSRETLSAIPVSTTLENVYAGKIWRDWSEGGNGQPARWRLCWYGSSSDPARCKFEVRDIILVN